MIKIKIYEFDYCILESYSCNTDNTCCGEETSLTCCTSVAPCSVGEGGCTSYSYCSGDLVCGSGNCDISLGFTAGAIFYIQIQQFYIFGFDAKSLLPIYHLLNYRSQMLHAKIS